mgnify:CR=1 FL=1
MSATYPEEIAASELAQTLGVSLQHLSFLAAKGRVVRASHGKYRFKESVQSYLAYLESQATAATPDANSPRGRMLEAKARLAEAEVAKVEAEWLPVEMIIRANTELAVVIRTKLLSIESKVPPEAREATRKAVHEALTELADHNPEEIVERVTAEVLDRASEAPGMKAKKEVAP